MKICDSCQEIESMIIPMKNHEDSNVDFYCDMCLINLTPVVDSIGCSCNCHKSGVAKILFKFILVFQRIFGTNKVCDCSMAHY